MDIISLVDNSTNDDVPKHQEIRVLSVDDTIQTLTRLHERLKLKDETRKPSKRAKKRIQSLETLTLTLALAEPAQLASEAMVTMCRAVALCFPKLKTLEIHSEMDSGTRAVFPIPVQVLTVLLHPNKGLKKLRELTLDSLHFHTDDDTMRLLVKAISKHGFLKSCYLYSISMTILTSGRSGMEKLVSALARRISKLVIVSCRLAPSTSLLHSNPSGHPAASIGDNHWAGSCLVKVCKSTTLHEFKLHNLDELLEEHVVLMSEALSDNRCLRKLSILKSQELADADALAANDDDSPSKMMTSPEIQKAEQQERLSSDAGTLAIANMLRKNSTLQELCLSSFDFNEYSALFLGNALERDNVTLQNLWLMIPAFNGGTSSFPVDDPRIGYFLRLNRAGRQAFVPTPSSSSSVVTSSTTIPNDQERRNHLRQELVESLITSRRDIDCSFYKLQNRPFLCDTDSHLDRDSQQHQGQRRPPQDFGYDVTASAGIASHKRMTQAILAL